MALDYDGGTPPLDAFLTDYNDNDNVWWVISCGHHQNLFDAAIERIDELTGEREILWGKVADLTQLAEAQAAAELPSDKPTWTEVAREVQATGWQPMEPS